MLLQEKPAGCAISQIYFDKELYMFRTDVLSVIRSLNTVYTAIGICHAGYVEWQTVNITSMTSTYCCAYSVETPDDRQ